MKQNGQLPSPRSGQTITTIGKYHYLFGGIDFPKDINKMLPSNEVYTLKITSTQNNPNSCQWALKQCSGDIPMPRCNHSACKLPDDRLLIFGGYYNSNYRFNDTFYLKTSVGQWFQPPNQKSQGEPKNAQSKIGAPQPRANHTATFHKGKVYIFGGHGGTDFKRTAFNDLYQLDIQTFDWQLINPSGNPPQARGGHVATMLANKDKLMICGGWNSITQFKNIFIWDMQKNSWQDPQLNHQIQKWNLGGIIVPSIPSWKYFIFGGSTGNFVQGGNRTAVKYSDQTWYMDIQSQQWKLVNLQQNDKGVIEKPRARQSPSLFYSLDDQRLFMFGGWSNNWLGDLWCLPVGLITGPPYAIFNMRPDRGPVTGKTRVTISGAGFRENLGTINVRFQGQKGYVDVQGTFVSEDTIVCDTPSFQQFGPRPVQIRVCFGKLDFTITHQNFTYYLNTKADKTIAYGCGLLMQNHIGTDTCFLIQARNTDGKNRDSGSDQFQIQIRRMDIPELQQEVMDPKKRDQLSEQQKKQIQAERQQRFRLRELKVNIPFVLQDLQDGSYLVKYLFEQQCKVQIDIRYKNQKNQLQPIRGNPFISRAIPQAKPKNNQMNGPQVTNYVFHELKEIGQFLQTSKENIQIRNKVLDGNVKQLLKVMESLKLIQDKKDQIALNLDVIDQTLKTLQKNHEVKKQGELKKCHKYQEEIKSLNQMAILVDKGITNSKTSQGQKTKQAIKKFEQHLKEYMLHLKKQSFYSYKTGVQGSFQRIEQVNGVLADFQRKLDDYKYYEQMFKFQDNENAGCRKILDQIQNEVKTMTRLWEHIKICQIKFNGYLNLKWNDIDCGQIEDEVKKLRNGLQPIKVSDRKCGAFVGITEQIKRWSTFIPMVSDLRDPAMITQDGRHWKKVKSLVNDNFEIDDNLYLNKIWDLKLYELKESIEDITEMAKNQAKMEKQLNKVIIFWKDIQFELVSHKDTNIKTLKMIQDHFQTLEEHQLIINTMLLSKYVAYFEKDVQKWKSDLGDIYDVIQLLSGVQKTWSFLQNLFIQSEQVKRELPKQSQMFIDIDKDMKQVMQIGVNEPNILKFCTINGMVKRLQKIQKDLKVCEKALNDFLDSKRTYFPRFYFVSVSDLLDILSNGNSPAKINRHMSKIFQAIQYLKLDQRGQGRPKATCMKSCVGIQEVNLSKPLPLQGKVQIYLQDMINAMNETLRSIAQQSLKVKETMQRDQWLNRDPAQITLLVNNIFWSNNTESCLKKITEGINVNAMKEYFQQSVKLLNDLIKMVQGKLQKQMRQKIMCLITMDTHSRDVIDKLIHENVKKPDSFQWQSQLKFYWDKEKNNSQIKIADASFWYNYQYLGNGPRLVVTPLTDRIYVTATQALHLKMGCAPAGPAGTGKTQTTKDLANSLAKACYVFNCSGQMNYESMGNIYKGLASSGCWGCFDQFNRLLPQVLSVCSVQFKSVTDAIKEKKERFILQGDQISLNPTCGVFITMNPGYLGRAQLPQGLKALFRPITVVVPDLQLICQNMLMAEGFIQAKVLAKKFVTLYMLCLDLLSKQKHYDWGLRAIKSVLVVAGGFKRSQPEVGEAALLMRALRDFNFPKIAYADLYIFNGLLEDLFPGIHIERKRDLKFEKVIEEVAVQNKLYQAEQFILKIVQLSQLLQIRHCVFCMGPPGAGKTSTWKTLGKAQDKIYKKTTIIDINPKTVSTKDLYGYNLPSKEWKDGLLSKMMRFLSQQQDTNPKWLLMDGDLDANWIQSMNSVMDDNRILTLANNERIPLKGHMRMIFQIRDLRFATPATVSRAGILYISDDTGYQWEAYVKSWINKHFPINQQTTRSTRQSLEKLFQKYVKNTLLYVKKHCKLLVPVSPMSMIISLCKILQALIKQDYKNFEYPFVFSIVWAIGGCLTEKDAIDYRKEFSNWWKSQWKSVVKYPSKGSIFDYYIGFPKGEDSPEQSKLIQQWQFVPIEFDSSKGDTMGNLTVPTKETVAAQFFIKKYIQVSYPVLMIGFAGCGKTQLAKGILRNVVQQKPDLFAYQLINFNYYTDSNYLQSQLEQTLQKKAGRQYGPPGKLKLIYFIDDLNMPQLDQFDTQNAISLLRQHADYQHWYDISKLSLKDIINTQTIASMNPSAGSFFVNPRYQRHFWTISIPFPDVQSLFTIYSTFLNGHTRRFRTNIQQLSPLIIRSALALHQTVISSFRKTAINFHYQFNLRHLSNVFQGMLLSDHSRFVDPEKFVKLWIHESERTYGDRLVSMDNLQKYNNSMCEQVKKSFSRYQQLQKYFQQNNPQLLIFSDFTGGMNGGERLYDLMPNDKLYSNIHEGLVEYNNNNPQMNLVLFQDAMKHICRISRIIMPSSGHALLVGVGGSGKQSLSKLASFMMFMERYMITISSNYGMNDLKTDLQFLYNKTGIKEQLYLFLFNQGQITNQRFLVYINDLLSSGEIADLYTPDQKQGIMNQVRSKVKGEGKPDTKENCWNYFIDKVKAGLHMSLCFSPVGDALRRRARQFPALVNCSVIDWFFPWPKQALYDVGKNKLQQLQLGQQQIRNGIVAFMPYSFQIVNRLSIKLEELERRFVYTTPKSFLQLIKLFQTMLTKKRSDLLNNKQRYQTGLAKLRQTSQIVAVIEQEVKVKQIEAEQLKVSADAFAAKVGIQKQKVQVENSKAKEQQAKCEVIKRKVQQKKMITQKELKQAQPLVQNALASLNSIAKKDFSDTKNYASPPSGVPQVFSATIWLIAGFFPEIEIDKNRRPKTWDWKAAQKMMKNPEALKTCLLDFKDKVDNMQVAKYHVEFVKKQYLNDENFKPAVIYNKSKAASGVCSWVINIVAFHDVMQKVGPMRKDLDQAKSQQADAKKKLNEVQQIVAKLNSELAVLDSEYMKALQDKNNAIREAQRCARRLNLAQRLVKALGSENERWQNSIVSLQEQIQVIVGDVLMASAFVSYAGPFNKKFREEMIYKEFFKFFKNNKIPTSPNLDPIKMMTDQSVAALWNMQGLPSDKVSIENGSILTNSQRYPLMIDPQLQGITWIREKQKNNKLESLRLGTKELNRKLELSVEQGYSALIQNMDQKIDAVLMPIISRSFIIKGKNKIIKFAGKDLQLNQNFRLFLHTKLSNPHYPPEIHAQATLINFTVTEDGLGDQLLTLVVQRERPDLAQKKIELINQQNDFKIKLKQLQNELLYKLANSQGDILDNISLIENLQYSKKISVQISQKVQIAKTTQIKINHTSEKYRAAASRGALIYFLLSDLCRIYSFYKYSLESFIVVINRAIDQITEKVQKESNMKNVDDEGNVIVDKKEPIKEDEKEKSERGEEQVKQEQPQIKSNKSQEVEGQKEQMEDPMTPRTLQKRVQQLIDSITYTTFQYTRRGLFQRHKLIVSTMLTLRIQIREGELSNEEVEHFIIGKVDSNPPPIPQSLKSFLNDSIWAACKGLQTIPEYNGFGNNLQSDMLQWKKWYQQQRVQVADLPKNYKQLNKFKKLLLLRAMRRDRLTSALNLYVSQVMGEQFVEQPPFNIFQTFEQTDRKTPIFFVLFPGVDPTPQVQRVAAKFNISTANRKFTNISMGQGQQKPAQRSLFQSAKKGYWIMLQNVHLMQNWLYGINGLEGFLEKVNFQSHPNFRVFISSEPPPLPQQQIIPQSILQSSIKVANQAPQYLKANLRRAYSHFDQDFLDKCDKKPNQFKACLFALCYFHSLVLGRKKFGSQGWSRVYNFNDGDLTICADVLYNYLSKYDVVPWDDLRYIFGQIMYGGHITDAWDRITNATYLKVLIKPQLLMPNFSLLYHLFKSPDPAKYDYKAYRTYIQQKLPSQVPQMFGMHPNAQIGYLTQNCQTLCDTILEVQGGSGGKKGGKDQGVMAILMEYKAKTPVQLNILDINAKIKQKTPFVVVCLQQCQRMNLLLNQIKKTLQDLRLGLTGALNITDAMQALQKSLQFNKVPQGWASIAYPSKKILSMWFQDLIARNQQLIQWTDCLITPKSLCISYLFNPMSFLTAIMQVTARSKNLPLDNMTLQTNVTYLRGSQQVTGPADNGAYVHGLYLQGAAWENGGQGQDGYLIEQKPKELHPVLPVVNVIAVLLKQKKVLGQYRCPVYYTSMRGATFIFAANLNMQSEDSQQSKWILSGTCLLMSDD